MKKRVAIDQLPLVGPGTPGGELLRRYWFPVAGSSELQSGTARAVRLLGEDFVLFRTTTGQLGMLDEHCRHRGASLCLGRVNADSISCPYHGWTFDSGGRCLRMPAEPVNRKLLERARTRACRVQELGGLVFAYAGPEPAPLLPRYDVLVRDGALRDIGRALLPCNWLQIMENSVDPTHVEWLHGHHLSAVRGAHGDSVPTHYLKHHEKIGFDRTELGIVKRRVVQGGSETDDDWKVGHPLVFPCTLRVGSGRQHRLQIRVPVDDTHTLHFWYACYLPAPGRSAPPQSQVPVYDVPWQDADGKFIVDFVDGGDIMTWVTQGPIADRKKEMLVGSDRGITLLRNLLQEQIALVQSGADPMGVVRDPEQNRVIELTQEDDKYGAGRDFLMQSIAMSHVRYSPLREQIVAMLADE
jgi:5,5'-dehydrodivanillate O-demethylase